jgi:hypothetical protein
MVFPEPGLFDIITLPCRQAGVPRYLHMFSYFFLQAGIHRITIDYFQGPRLYVALILEVKPPGAWTYAVFNTDDYR